MAFVPAVCCKKVTCLGPEDFILVYNGLTNGVGHDS